MPPAARLTDMHTCPMFTGPVPHVGGPITGPGAPTVLISFLPAANVTSMAVCIGPPDMIAKGSAGVFVNFLPAARLGDQTAHGGVIILGDPTCIIGEVGAPSPGAAGVAGVVAGLLNSGIVQQQLAQASVYAVQGVFSAHQPAPQTVGVIAIRTAEVVNAEMVADGMLPAWAPGTMVTTEVVPAGTEFDMIVEPTRLDDIMRGNTRVGNWATTDRIVDQASARDRYSITNEFKPDASIALKVKTKVPVRLNRGIAGPMGDLKGRGPQVQFLTNTPGTIGPCAPPRLLPEHS